MNAPSVTKEIEGSLGRLPATQRGREMYAHLYRPFFFRGWLGQMFAILGWPNLAFGTDDGDDFLAVHAHCQAIPIPGFLLLPMENARTDSVVAVVAVPAADTKAINF